MSKGLDTDRRTIVEGDGDHLKRGTHMRGDHHDGFDRDRWVESVADRTLYVKALGDEQAGSDDGHVEREPTECGLCDERVLPVTDDGTECCPICGFAVGESNSTLRPSERIGSR